MKKLVALLLMSMQLLNMPSVLAQSAIEPYVLMTQIIHEPIGQSECQALISQQGTQASEVSQLTANLESYHAQLGELEVEFNQLTSQIDDLQHNPTYSVTHAEQGLNEAIETMYAYYQENDPAFMQKTSEEQLFQIQSDETVIAWQQYFDEVQLTLTDAMNRRAEIESAYQQLIYTIESETEQLVMSEQDIELVNQCLLYPYSVPKIASDALFIDQYNLTLSEYIAQLDTIVQKLVPFAYRKVKFEDIYQKFNAPTIERLESSYVGKQNIVFDEQGLLNYQHTKELTLADVDILAQIAQANYWETADDTQYFWQYQRLIELKEQQFHYFMPINDEAWQLLKQNFADYLNIKQLFSADVIEAVSQFHYKNQVKLVLFDEQQNLWLPVSNERSAYLEQYLAKEIMISKTPVELTENIISTTELASTTDETTMDTTTELTLTTENHLDYLKEKLTKHSDIKTDSKQLPKPSSANHKSKVKDSVTKPKTASQNKLTLPTTGEMQGATLIALVILLVAALLLLPVLVRRRKRIEHLDEIDLE